MKALILSAGLGTRLRPLTDTTPKVLIPVASRPLLEYHFRQLEKAGVKEVMINTHWLAEKVRVFCEEYASAKKTSKSSPLKASVFYEPVLTGTLGPMLANRNFFAGCGHILVIYGDVLTDIDYVELLAYHKSRKNVATIVCHTVPNVEEKGMVVINADDTIASFKEKPKKSEIISNYVNAGIYIFDEEIFSHLKPFFEKANPDFGKDAFPYMLERGISIGAYKLPGFLIDIGTPANYRLANEKAVNLQI